MKNLKTFITIFAVVISTPTFATDKNIFSAGKWYVNGSGGTIKLNGLCSTCEDSGTGIQLHIGTRFNDHFITETGIAFGEAGNTNMVTVPFGVAGQIPIGGKFSLLGKGGIHFWRYDYPVPFFGRVQENGTDPYLGLGAEFDFNDNLSARFEWTRYLGDDIDVDAITGGIVIYF